MELIQAAAYHATTPMAGWDGAAWTDCVAMGDFHTFDRFITERTFGLKKRVLTTVSPIPSAYQALRDPSGRTYLITSESPDFHGSTNYMNSYLILQADYLFEVLTLQKVQNSAGVDISSTKVPVAEYFGDMERYSGETSRTGSYARYSVMSIQLPIASADHVNTDTVLRASGEEYEVTEVLPLLKVLDIKAVKREG